MYILLKNIFKNLYIQVFNMDKYNLKMAKIESPVQYNNPGWNLLILLRSRLLK